MTADDDAGPKMVVVYIPVSAEALAEAEGTAEAVGWAINATPDEWEQRQAEMRVARAAERAAATPQPVTLERLVDALGWNRRYVEHVVQSYCTCHDSSDGWYVCPHADDEGVAP